MTFPIPPTSRPHTALERPAIVQTVAREDVLWNRPVFKAPRLELHPKLFDATIFAEDMRLVGLGQR